MGGRPGWRTRALVLARPALRTAIRAADLEHARTARQRAIRRAAGSRRRRIAGSRALAHKGRRGDGVGVARRRLGQQPGAPGRAPRAPAATRCAPRCSAPNDGPRIQPQPGDGRGRAPRFRARRSSSPARRADRRRCSMAMGEWLSVTSSRELNQQKDRHRGRRADADARRGKGGDDPDLSGPRVSTRRPAARARRAVDGDKDSALDTLVREELGIDPNELGGSPWAAAARVVRAVRARRDISGGAAVSGLPAPPRSLASLAASGVALVLIGAGTSLLHRPHAVLLERAPARHRPCRGRHYLRHRPPRRVSLGG